MKIFIDFDDVLFNTKDFKNDLLNVFIKNGITKEQFFEESYWGNKYNLEKQIKSVGEKYNADSKKIKKDADIFLKDLKKYVFSDVCDFLEYVGKENLFMVSYGHSEFQNKKIQNADMNDYFKKVVITHNVKSKVIMDIINDEKTENETLYFMDDRVEYIEEVKESIPDIKTVLIKRPEGRYDDEPSNHCDYAVKNLEEMGKIINA